MVQILGFFEQKEIFNGDWNDWSKSFMGIIQKPFYLRFHVESELGDDTLLGYVSHGRLKWIGLIIKI